MYIVKIEKPLTNQPFSAREMNPSSGRKGVTGDSTTDEVPLRLTFVSMSDVWTSLQVEKLLRIKNHGKIYLNFQFRLEFKWNEFQCSFISFTFSIIGFSITLSKHLDYKLRGRSLSNSILKG